MTSIVPAMVVEVGGSPVKPENADSRNDILSWLDDDFNGTGDIETRGWGWYKEGAVASQVLGAGELDMTITAGAGGIGGATAFWFDGTADGDLLFKTVRGPFDARLRARIRNTADAANPAVTSFRIAGLAVHDPNRASNVFNYVHIGGGSTNTANNRVEWKTTDDDGGASNDTSAFNAVDWSGGNMDIDLRIVRRRSNLQLFDLLWRPSSGDLLSGGAWNTLIQVNRASNASPDRDTNGALANLAIPMPPVVQVGAMIYSQSAAHDIRMHLVDFKVREATL